MPIELKITVDDPTEMAAIIASLHGQMAGGENDAPLEDKRPEKDNPPAKKRAAKAKPEKDAEPEKAEPADAEKAEPAPAEDDAKSDEPASIDDLRKAIANAIEKLPGGQGDVLKIMEKFTPEGEKVSASTVTEGDRAELIHMLNSKAEGA